MGRLLLWFKWVVFNLACLGSLERYLDLRAALMRLAIRWGLYDVRHLGWLAKVLRDGDTVIDVGANFGAYSMRLSSVVGATGKIVAVEPLPWVYSRLQSNLRTKSNVTCIAKALSDGSVSRLTLNVPLLFGKIPEPSLASAEIGSDYVCMAAEVEVTTLDELCAEIPKIDFVKVDIEGHEMAFLRGARKIIAKHQPLVQLECNDLQQQFGNLSAVAAELGYRLGCLDESGQLKPLTAQSNCFNYYLVPPTQRWAVHG